MVAESYYVGLPAILFTIGVVGVVIRRNPLVMFMSIELMLNAANLALVAFGRRVGNPDGQAVVFFAMAVAAAEVAGGGPLLLPNLPLPPRAAGGGKRGGDRKGHPPKPHTPPPPFPP